MDTTTDSPGWDGMFLLVQISEVSLSPSMNSDRRI